jgi:alkanesulfonate monooxygenase SsuD/methylene tetrahydromethanopterin reductase-like flavin-dependent oxidoreductase (luciferase family)
VVFCSSRFNFVQPRHDPAELSARYRAGLEMASYCDDNGFQLITVEEHHGAENNWSPTPLLNAGMILARTRNVGVMVSALLVPLHDPVRLAEDIAVIDLASGGRLTVIAGIGYRPSEFAAHGKDWGARGALMDEALEVMLAAWTGEPFEYRGTTMRVTPAPFTQPHPPLLLGGTSKVSVRRAARLGLPYLPAINRPDLEAYYADQCERYGTTGTFMQMPADHVSLFVADDPDRAWAELGQHFLAESAVYRSWQTLPNSSVMHSDATTVEELRAGGPYVVLTPEQCIERAQQLGDGARFALHPLVGGMPIDEAWTSLQLFIDQVLPKLA